MFVAPDCTTIYFDVDETLICHDIEEIDSECVEILALSGDPVWVRPHEAHVAQLKAHKNRGQTIVVWSQQGAEWCRRVVEALALQDFVDICVSKPYIFYDDLHPTEFMGWRVYLKGE